MTRPAGFTCRSCGEWHEELPFSYHAEAPAQWSPALAGDDSSELNEELCVIRDEAFFIHALIRLPVVDADNDFAWGVWVSLSEENFGRTVELWEQEGREREPPMFGWLSTALPTYEPSTLSLKTMIHTQPVGIRPHVELEATDHPLAIEQREGITVARVQELAERLLHPA